ncbi:hypothetical protein H8356DRAFT_1436560 [Neocallimastix lanati (nom. inval.)]|nr:hypothetical protein H8356DRAFT_1436560 [Neocallimastix sp. JGI-2020a]
MNLDETEEERRKKEKLEIIKSGIKYAAVVGITCSIFNGRSGALTGAIVGYMWGLEKGYLKELGF